MEEQDHPQLRMRALRRRPMSDVWSDDYSSERSPYAKTENSSGTAAWSIRDDSNAELIVPQVMIHPNSPYAADDVGDNADDSSSTGGIADGISQNGIGHIRLIVCGDSGIGKTALIQALTMLPEITACEVAVDADYSSPSVMTSLLEAGRELDEESGDDQESSASEGELAIQETYASTMTMPTWSRDQDAGEHQFFVKNLCLVDTPGYGACLDAQTVISSVSSYIEWQFQKTSNMLNHMYPNTSEITRLVHNPYGAHTHIDACLYIILDRVKRVDIEYMRAIHHLCNIVPVVVKHEQLTIDQDKELRRDMLRELKENDIDMFDLQEAPFVVSDFKKDGMLNHLKDAVLYSDIERLRRSTAQKFVAWRGSQILVSSSSDMSSTLTTSTLTTAETVDRIHALKTRHEQNINLFISRYVSEKRKAMERDMFERERALKSELASVERRKRAELLVSELNQLFQHGNMDDLKAIHLTSPPSYGNDMPKQQQGTWAQGNSASPLANIRWAPKSTLEHWILFVICLHFLLDVLSIIYSQN